MKISRLYSSRFNMRELKKKNMLWKVLCCCFLQRYINLDDIVVDIGAGHCEFINNIRCRLKYAVDINEDTQRCAHSDISVFQLNSSDLLKFQNASVDVVFMSNFLEHLKDKDEVNATLTEIYRILKNEGRLLIIQPNIKYTYKEYWDFYDHQIPFSHLSLKEALINHNFEIVELIPKFLPFTTKGWLPKSAFLLRVYLKAPLLYKLFGKQMFIVAKKINKNQV